MSDAPQAPGWWQAMDGRWYPPQAGSGDAPDGSPPPDTSQPPISGPAGSTPPPPLPPGVPPVPSGPVEAPGAAPDPVHEPAPVPAPDLLAAPAAPPSPPDSTQADDAAHGSARRAPGLLSRALTTVLGLMALLTGATGVFVLLVGNDTAGELAAPDRTVDDEGGDPPSPPADEPRPPELPVDGPIATDQRIDDELRADRTRLRYTFDAPDGAMLTLRVANDRESADRVIATLLDDAGQMLTRLVPAPAAERHVEVIRDHQGGGTFELVFEGGPAVFDFDVSVAVQRDAGVSGDAGDTVDTARRIDPGARVEGLLGGQDVVDVFILDVVAGTRLDVEAALDPDAEQQVSLAVVLDDVVLAETELAPGAAGSLTALLGHDATGVIAVRVTGGPATYSFVAELAPQQDAGVPGDASDQPGEERVIAPGVAFDGQVGDHDVADGYLLRATAERHTLGVAVAFDGLRPVVAELLDDTGGLLARLDVAVGGADEVAFDAEPGATYRLTVTGGRATYRIEID